MSASAVQNRRSRDLEMQHPGLANPEISKIIGEEWRAQTQEVKEEWKQLADVGAVLIVYLGSSNRSWQEEKLRHQQQHPDYRYQPRRNGRRGSTSEGSPSASSNKNICLKCGRRSLTTPVSQSAVPRSSTPSINPPRPVLPPPTASPTLTPTTRFLPMLNNLSLESPHVRKGHRPGPVPTAAIQAAALRERHGSDVSMTSPDSKRRRYEQGGHYATIRRQQPGTPYPFPSPMSSSNGPRRESLPRVDSLLRGSPPGSAPMGPPPRPGYHPSSHPNTSLNLPPLQTTSPKGSDKAQSMESIVRSMNMLAKIALLGKISPPLKKSTLESTSPRSAVQDRHRGAVVAVEGDNQEAVRTLTSWILTDLTESKDLHVKGIDGVKALDECPTMEDGEIASFEAPEQPQLSDYLKVLGSWHLTSKEMINFVKCNWTRLRDGTVQKRDDESNDSSNENKADEQQVTPVIVVPSYQLFASDTYATHVPILDNYSPADHWQWMATLWRGTVGPDVTIYVRDCGPEEMAREKFFEVKEEIRCLIVRRDKNNLGGRIDQPALRRASFEIAEWVRAMGKSALEK
ncbi:MAG: hypothetical protein M1820_008716 [Bogoriella megaspora]|nr:MAG: hypothetical protein M1820_008716 [Bogoriella megaspora]